MRQAAARLQKPQSYVVRQAVRDYAEHVGRLSETERRYLLDAFDRLILAIPARSASQVRKEIADVLPHDVEQA